MWNTNELKSALQVFIDDWTQVMLHPRTFFRERDRNEPWEQMIVFNIFCGIFAGIIKTVFTFGSAFLSVFVYPFLLLFITAIIGSVVFIAFKMCGGEEKFEPTMKMTGYTHAVSLLSFGIPGLGVFIGLYQIVLLTAVGKFLHELDTRTSFFAVVIPLLIYLALMFIISTIIGISFFGGVLSHKGELI